MVTPLRSGQGYMSVGDSAEEFISIHALGRERLLVFADSHGFHYEHLYVSTSCFPIYVSENFLSQI